MISRGNGASWTALNAGVDQPHERSRGDPTAADVLLRIEDVYLSRLRRPETKGEILAKRGAFGMREEIDTARRIGGLSRPRVKPLPR